MKTTQNPKTTRRRRRNLMSIFTGLFVRTVVVIVTRCLYRIRTRGTSNIPKHGGALLVSNHVTWVDALLISVVQGRSVRFLMAREIYESRVFKPAFKLMGAIPVSASSPHNVAAALDEARSALDAGGVVCIFAEGALTRNWNIGPFRAGLERIVKGTDHPIIPVYIGGAWGSIFSYYHGRGMVANQKRQFQA